MRALTAERGLRALARNSHRSRQIRTLASRVGRVCGLALGASVAMASVTAHAQNAFEPRDFASSEHEQRYRTLIEELRCLVCQNQNIAASNADLASDLRREVYRMVEDGKGAEEIAGFMVARYGEFVLYRPALGGRTLLLWIGPFVLAAAGLAVLLANLRRRRRAQPAPLDEAARERVRRIIEAGD